MTPAKQQLVKRRLKQIQQARQLALSALYGRDFVEVRYQAMQAKMAADALVTAVEETEEDRQHELATHTQLETAAASVAERNKLRAATAGRSARDLG